MDVRRHRGPAPSVLHHFSEDPSIAQFLPHVPPTNPDHPPAVWAIDPDHAPLYWFPRDCPRVTAWPRDDSERDAFATAWSTTARRVHVMEAGWSDRMHTTSIYRYDFEPSAFRPWPAASGQWISEQAVTAYSCSELDDLVELHTASGIELRVVESLWPAHDLAVSDAWDFSIVRMRNARPRR